MKVRLIVSLVLSIVCGAVAASAQNSDVADGAKALGSFAVEQRGKIGAVIGHFEDGYVEAAKAAGLDYFSIPQKIWKS